MEMDRERRRGGYRCYYKNCKSSYSDETEYLKFHRFPKDEIKCKKWLQACGRELLEGIPISDYNKKFKVCSKHFEDTMYLNPYDKHNLLSKAEPIKFVEHEKQRSPDESDMSSETSDDEYNPGPAREHRTARKSVSQPTQTYTTRRQAARNATKALRATSDHFMANFNPETSVREKRKLSRKIHPPSNVRRPAGALYDENGVHITSGVDLCDCLNEDCVGCFFECPKCESLKCSTDCRLHRKYMIEQIEYHGYDHVIKNPLFKH